MGSSYTRLQLHHLFAWLGPSPALRCLLPFSPKEMLSQDLLLGTEPKTINFQQHDFTKVIYSVFFTKVHFGLYFIEPGTLDGEADR